MKSSYAQDTFPYINVLKNKKFPCGLKHKCIHYTGHCNLLREKSCVSCHYLKAFRVSCVHHNNTPAYRLSNYFRENNRNSFHEKERKGIIEVFEIKYR
jgi:hypothetical protein